MRSHLRRRVALSVTGAGAAFVALLAFGQASPAPSTAASLGSLERANAHRALPVRGGAVDSLNWSGYAVTSPNDAITGVSSTFVVPAAGLLPPGFAATWAGIGGYSTADLIQAGVSEQSLPSLPILGDQYDAWYELLPNPEVQLTGCAGDPNCTVTPGEHVSVAIDEVSRGLWNIALADAGHWSWSQTVRYRSSQSSAEWILEAPTVIAQVLVAPVGDVAFGPTSTFTAGGATHTIAQGSPVRINMSAGLINEAAPSALARDGQSFKDCAYALSCPAP